MVVRLLGLESLGAASRLLRFFGYIEKTHSWRSHRLAWNLVGVHGWHWKFLISLFLTILPHKATFAHVKAFVRYAAIAFGRPCSIDDSDCDIDTVSDIKTNTKQPPRQAAQLDYHRWKFRLYRIVGPFLGRRLQTNRLASVQSIHAQLLSWQTQLPENLRLQSYKDKGTTQAPSLLQMQALALQLTYDNIQIILHRSLAFGSGPQVSSTDRSIDDLPRSALSRKQLFESALRTSELNDYRHVLHACGKTHAAMHVGICLFTAGVVLCAFAISEPLSATSEAAKNGVMNILRFQHDPLLNEHLLSTQSVKILEDLVAVLLRSENSLIRGDKTTASQTMPQTASEEEIQSREQDTITQEPRLFGDSRLDDNSLNFLGGLSNLQPEGD